MGGNALKTCITRRYNADEYYAIEDDVVCKLHNLFPTSDISPIKAYAKKESFGDLDVLIVSDKLPVDWVDMVVNKFDTKESVKNGNVLSFEYRQFQVDLIVTPSEEFQSSVSYFAYNDLGNLLGRVAHSMGLKLGHDGLSYNWRIDTYQFKNIVLLTDFKDILPVLGYSYERYAEGFDTLEDIFKFVVSSDFFNKDIYLLNNRNHTSRIRDAKRKTYMDFLTWLENYEEKDSQKSNGAIIKEYGKDTWLPYLFDNIEGFKETYDEVMVEWNQAVLFKSKYNGGLVMQWTGLSCRELGDFMKWHKSNYGERFTRDVCAINPELIQRWVEHYFKLYREQHES